MNEKEFNLAILKELRKIAGKVFAKVTVSKEGTYTAAELWNEKDAFGESIVIDYKGTESDIYTAEIDVFKMQVTPCKFEQLCKVRQVDKMRFTYGKAEQEIIKEKAMYYTGSLERGNYDNETHCCPVTGNGNYKLVTKKTTLKKLSDYLATDKKGRSFYKSGDTWYLISENELSEQSIERIENEPDYLFKLLEKYNFSLKNELTPIFKALFETLKAERINGECEPKKTVVCDVMQGRDESGNLRMNSKRLKVIGNGLYKDDENLYFEHELFCYCLGGYTRGVATFLKEQGNNIQNKIREMIEQGGISTDSAKILYDKMRRNDAPEKSESVQKVNEDYPPEPYNESDTGDMDRSICDHAATSANSWGNSCPMLPNYLRQKVFPTELFNARRKISRFKPRYFVVYTNYHLCKENALERKRNGNTSVYRALIRGETKNNILICR